MTRPEPFCALADIADPGARGPFAVTIDGERKGIFVVRRGDRVWAYVDSCPHVGAPLAMEPDRYLDLSGSEILCSMHGARFDVATGLCTLGPCRGQRLSPFGVHILNGMVIPAATPKAV